MSAITAQRGALRVAAVGSVDDGKSTLIGRLLHDTKSILDDQLAAVGRASRRHGDGSFNLALLTDGLRAEREQGITIDVAYRYVTTPNRSLILADTPGHVQYTRNMVTGASVSDVALLLVDARNGVVEQTRRHAFVAGLLSLAHVVVVINKMDLVGWDRRIAARIHDEVAGLLEQWPHPPQVHVVPASALHGDNVVDRSTNTPWYDGPALLELLEGLDVEQEHEQGDCRLAVQWVIRPRTAAHHDHRSYAGRLDGGPLRVGDQITVLPSGATTTVAGLHRGGTSVDEAHPGESIGVLLTDEVDVGRGDVLVAGSHPVLARHIVADVSWMHDRPVGPGERVIVKHLTRQVTGRVISIRHRWDLGTLRPVDADRIGLNDIARVEIELDQPVPADAGTAWSSAGRFIIIDPATRTTAAAGVIREVLS